MIDATHVEIDGHRYVNFASNNYLGLTHHPRVIAAFESEAHRSGVGSGAAALVTGYTEAHASAERAITAHRRDRIAEASVRSVDSNASSAGRCCAVSNDR